MSQLVQDLVAASNETALALAQQGQKLVQGAITTASTFEVDSVLDSFISYQKFQTFDTSDSLYGASKNATQCPSAQWCFDSLNYCIQVVPYVPLCIIALLIGIYCSKQIAQSKFKFNDRSKWIYKVVFFLYGIMMTRYGRYLLQFCYFLII